MKTALDRQLKHIEDYLDSVGLYFVTVLRVCQMSTEKRNFRANLCLRKAKKEIPASQIISILPNTAA